MATDRVNNIYFFVWVINGNFILTMAYLLLLADLFN